MDKPEDKLQSLEDLGLTEEEQLYISKFQSIVHYKKGTILIKEGQSVFKSYHIIKGCVRKFHLKDGEEKTSDFFTEEDPITSNPRSKKSYKSKYSFECIEDTSMTEISFEQEELLYAKFPKFQSMCRISTEKQLEEYQEKFSLFIASSPKERYVNLVKTRPDLLNRVPLYQLASYLGVKPETLSRIRKRLME